MKEKERMYLQQELFYSLCTLDALLFKRPVNLIHILSCSKANNLISFGNITKEKELQDISQKDFALYLFT